MKQIHAKIWKEDKWFIAKALEVEITSQGRSKKEAFENLKEAFELYFENLPLRLLLTRNGKLK